MKIIRHPLFMRPTPESELEQFIDRELRTLPDMQAPADLVSRVLQAAAARTAQPWWQKPVVQWPFPARLLFLIATTGLAGLLIYFSWGVSSGISFGVLTEEVAALSERFELIRGIGGALGGAAVAVARSAGPWLPWTAAGLLAVSYLTTLTLGTYCYRLASERI